MPECPYEEGLPPITPNIRGARELSRCRPLFLPRSEIRILVDKDGQGVKTVHCLHRG